MYLRRTIGVGRTTGLSGAICLLVALLAGASDSRAAERSMASPAVVELFTSQGCSSCPPADALLGELASRPDVIALAFHVDYWDSASWRDRFAMPEATGRQSRYVGALGLSTAFTPQVIVNGRASYVGSDKRGITAASGSPNEGGHDGSDAGARAGTQIKLGISAGALVVQLAPSASHKVFDVNLVSYLAEASTVIKGGENTGRSLHEFNIVRNFRRLGSWDGQAANFNVPLASLPADANRIAVLVQQPNQGYIATAAAVTLR